MAVMPIIHLATLVTLIKDSASGKGVAKGSILQQGCVAITMCVQFKDAVLWLEENLLGFKERKEGA